MGHHSAQKFGLFWSLNRKGQKVSPSKILQALQATSIGEELIIPNDSHAIIKSLAISSLQLLLCLGLLLFRDSFINNQSSFAYRRVPFFGSSEGDDRVHLFLIKCISRVSRNLQVTLSLTFQRIC